MSWALLLALPLIGTLTAFDIVEQPPTVTTAQWAAFAYLGVGSMFLGFFAWYRGLATGPMTQVSQVKLAQPVVSNFWAAVILHKQLTWQTIIGGVTVILCACIAVGRRTAPRERRRKSPER